MGCQQKTSWGYLTGLCLVAALLAAGGCNGEAEVAAGSLPQTAVDGPQGHVSQEPARSAPTPAPDAEQGISGTWLARCEGRPVTIELVAEDQALRGLVRAADGSVTPIKIGVFSGDAFLFETSSAEVGWLWSGEYSTEGLHGYRENVQTGVVESFTAQRTQ